MYYEVCYILKTKFPLGCQSYGLLYYVVLGTKRISAESWFPRAHLWQHKGEEVTRTRLRSALITSLVILCCSWSIIYAEKSWGVRGGVCLFPFIPKFMLMNNEILMMTKLWPGKSGNFTCLIWHPSHAICYVLIRWINTGLTLSTSGFYRAGKNPKPKQTKKPQTKNLTDQIHVNTFYWEFIISQQFPREALWKVHLCSILT